MYFAISYILLLFAKIGATVYIHIEDGLCIDLYDPLNMHGSLPTAAIPICGTDLDSACGTSDDDSPEASNPYDCKDCDTVTIYGFKYDKQLATGTPTCQGVFTFPEDYGDVYYNSDGYLYDAFGNQIGDASCDEPVPGGKFQNPWNSVGDGKTQPAITACSSSPAPSATCYHAADPDACPDQYDPGWCYCNNEAAMYPIQAGSDPCGYTTLPTTTTTSLVCSATD